MEKEIASLDRQTAAEGFWNDNQEAQAVLKRLAELRERLGGHLAMENKAEDLGLMLEMVDEEKDESMRAEVLGDIEVFVREYEAYELNTLFDEEHDDSNAILSLHAGAGGTEAQDWVEMLLRMYTRWAEASGYQTEILDYLAGDEAGVKSVTLLVKGRHAYGKLKCEKGVHRLIRVSPFDASGRRHTSFASVSVLPEITNEIEVKINADDLRIDTYRSSGAGGQHVNKTDSAVRITHLPTGIVVQCQNERSQHSNRLSAMKILMSRLYEIKLTEKDSNLQKMKGEHKDIAFGSQIRTYTLNPFSLVKDHRTSLEIGNVQAVLDGGLDELISACLHYNKIASV